MIYDLLLGGRNGGARITSEIIFVLVGDGMLGGTAITGEIVIALAVGIGSHRGFVASPPAGVGFGGRAASFPKPVGIRAVDGLPAVGLGAPRRLG